MIKYELLNDKNEIVLIDKFPNWGKNEICKGENSYTVVALKNDEVVGFISSYKKDYSGMIDSLSECFINVIKVDMKSRRLGIASTLLKMTEQWSLDNSLNQIRAWSSRDKTEVIPMWVASGYCICPTTIFHDEKQIPIDGVYAVKKIV